MTRLLVSVRDAREAEIALAAGVDLIDVKEPRAGSLGAASGGAIREVFRAVDRQAPVSAALGELLEFQAASWQDLPVDYAKLGLAGCADLSDWPLRWAQAWCALPPHCQSIAAAYADHGQARAPEPLAVLDQAIASGCRGLLLDTFDKRSGDLFAHCSRRQLRTLRERTRQAGLLLVLAGGLAGDALLEARALAPDYLAVRGAVCDGAREGTIDPGRVRRLVEVVRGAAAARRGG